MMDKLMRWWRKLHAVMGRLIRIKAASRKQHATPADLFKSDFGQVVIVPNRLHPDKRGKP